MDHVRYDQEISNLKNNLERLRNQYSQMLIFSDFCSTLLTATDLEKVTKVVVDQMGKLVGTHHIKFVRKEPESDTYVLYTIRGREIEQQRMLRKELGRNCFFMYCNKVHVVNGMEAFIAVPIKYEGENIGAILFEELNDEKIKQVNLRMLELFALPTGMVIKNCLLQGQLLKEKHIISEQHHKIQEDLRVAQKIQQAMLPSKTHTYGAYTLYGELKQAHYLGGDFYDHFWVDQEHVVFYLADVSGHGVASSLVTIYIKQLIRGIAASFGKFLPKPSKILQLLQERFTELRLDEDIYIGLLMGVFNANQHTITLANAGHNVEVMTIVDLDQRIDFHELRGLPINSWLPSTDQEFYGEKRFYLQRNDRVILMTDGAVEAKSEDGAMLDTHHLKDLFLENRRGEEYFQQLLARIYQHTGKEQLSDDIAFLMIKKG